MSVERISPEVTMLLSILIQRLGGTVEVGDDEAVMFPISTKLVVEYDVMNRKTILRVRERCDQPLEKDIDKPNSL